MLRTMRSPFLRELGIDFADDTEESHYDYDELEGTGQITPRFNAGERVHHDSFGLGTVKKFTDMGENSVVEVKFNAGQTKSLMVKYASLSKVQNRH